MGSSETMKIAFVIGNGHSRSVFDINQLGNHGVTYGCNLLIQDQQLDNCVACDRKLAIHLISQGYDKLTNLWTRQRWLDIISANDAKALPEPIAVAKERWDKEIHWGSGTHAANIAAEQGADVIVMLGFDLWPREDGLGNIYKDVQPFYEDRQVDPRCWIYQFSRLFQKFPNTSFVQIQPHSWKDPGEWTSSENYSRDDFHGLREWLKEL